MVTSLEIVQIDASEMANFAYLVFCPETLQGVAIDPSVHPERLLEAADQRAVTLTLLLNTHGHQDHIAGNPLLLEKTGIKLAAHPADLPEADIPLEEGLEIEVGQGRIRVLHTPGHTPGSVVFSTGTAIVTGDTLFVSRCGRADLPGSRVADLYASLQRLKQLPRSTRIYPGHDYGPTPTSTIEWELNNNAFLKCPDLASFIKLRNG
jgi:glyoxylase-like metal-dependent hydrolase (beta-lactamase superfamily II)